MEDYFQLEAHRWSAWLAVVVSAVLLSGSVVKLFNWAEVLGQAQAVQHASVFEQLR